MASVGGVGEATCVIVMDVLKCTIVEGFRMEGKE